jgi:WD40 repeat protein
MLETRQLRRFVMRRTEVYMRFTISFVCIAIGGCMSPGPMRFDDAQGPHEHVEQTVTANAARALASIRQEEGNRAIISQVKYSPDGCLIACADRDYPVMLYDVTAKKYSDLLSRQFTKGPVAFSPDGKMLATAGRSHTVRLWELDNGAELRTLELPDSLSSVTFSPDGKIVVTTYLRFNLLAGVTPRGEARLWEVATGKTITTVLANDGPIFATAFSPDGKTLALVSGSRFAQYGVQDGKLRIVDVGSGAVEREFDAHDNWAVAVNFSPDGKSILTGSADRTAKLWDSGTGRLKLTLRGHTDVVSSVTFSRDGRSIMTADSVVVRLWDAATGVVQEGFIPNGEGCRAVDVAPDGKLFVTGDATGGIALWQFTPPE